MAFELTRNEIYLALSFALAGFIFSMRPYILWLNSLSPIEGLAVFYIIYYSSLYALSRFGILQWHFKQLRFFQIVGVMLITFSFFIIYNQASPYVQEVTHPGEASNADVSVVYFQTEDGATYSFWHDTVGITNLEQLRVLTFILSPALLSLLGGLLFTGTIKSSIF